MLISINGMFNKLPDLKVQISENSQDCATFTSVLTNGCTTYTIVRLPEEQKVTN